MTANLVQFRQCLMPHYLTLFFCGAVVANLETLRRQSAESEKRQLNLLCNIRLYGSDSRPRPRWARSRHPKIHSNKNKVSRARADLSIIALAQPNSPNAMLPVLLVQAAHNYHFPKHLQTNVGQDIGPHFTFCKTLISSVYGKTKNA